MYYQQEPPQSPRQEQTQLSYVTRNAQMLEMDLILISPRTSQDHAIEVAPIASVSPDLLNLRKHSSLHGRKDEPHTSPSSLIPSYLQYSTTTDAGNDESNPTRLTQQPLRSYDPMLLPRLESAHSRSPPFCSFSEEEHDQTHKHDMDDDHKESFPLKYVFVPLTQTSPKFEMSKPPLPPSCSPTSAEWLSLPPAIPWGAPYPTKTMLPQLGVDDCWTTKSFEPIQMTTIDNSWKLSDIAHFDSNISSHDTESMIFSSGDDSDEEDEECLDGMKFLSADV